MLGQILRRLLRLENLGGPQLRGHLLFRVGLDREKVNLLLRQTLILVDYLGRNLLGLFQVVLVLFVLLVVVLLKLLSVDLELHLKLARVLINFLVVVILVQRLIDAILKVLESRQLRVLSLDIVVL